MTSFVFFNLLHAQ
jgi:GTPase involved in cell partitioning and DNA repair